MAKADDAKAKKQKDKQGGRPAKLPNKQQNAQRSGKPAKASNKKQDDQKSTQEDALAFLQTNDDQAKADSDACVFC